MGDETQRAWYIHTLFAPLAHTCDILEVLRFTTKQKPFLWVSTSSNAAIRTYHTARTRTVLSRLLSACPVFTTTTFDGQGGMFYTAGEKAGGCGVKREGRGQGVAGGSSNHEHRSTSAWFITLDDADLACTRGEKAVMPLLQHENISGLLVS